MAAYKSTSPDPSEILYDFDLFFEIFFGVSMIQEFITDFVPKPG
jgi:hypothetical protein